MYGEQTCKKRYPFQSSRPSVCVYWTMSKKTGKSIIVTRKGEPIALVTPPPPPPKSDSWLGCMKDRIKITGDIISPVLDEKEWEVLKD